jgi:hypothetical protein
MTSVTGSGDGAFVNGVQWDASPQRAENVAAVIGSPGGEPQPQFNLS